MNILLSVLLLAAGTSVVGSILFFSMSNDKTTPVDQLNNGSTDNIDDTESDNFKIVNDPCPNLFDVIHKEFNANMKLQNNTNTNILISESTDLITEFKELKCAETVYDWAYFTKDNGVTVWQYDWNAIAKTYTKQGHNTIADIHPALEGKFHYPERVPEIKP